MSLELIATGLVVVMGRCGVAVIAMFHPMAGATEDRA